MSRNERILTENLETLKKYALAEHCITDPYFIGDIDLVILELIEYGMYSNFNAYKYKLFNESQLDDFIEFYKTRRHANCVVTVEECNRIIDILFF